MRKTLLAFLMLSACSGTSDTPGDDDGSGSGDSTQQDYDGVASSIAANLSSGELPAMVDAINMAYGRTPGGYTITDKIDPTGLPYQLLDGVRGGITIQYKLYCRDAANLNAPCNGTESQAHVRPIYQGTVAAANASIDGVQRTTSWIVRDLQLPSAKLGGSGTSSFTSHLASGDYSIAITDTLKNTLFDPANPTLPTAGTLDMTMTITRSRDGEDRMFDVAAHLVFSTSGMATLTLDSSKSYSIAMASGSATKL